MKKRRCSVFVAMLLVLWLPAAIYIYRLHGHRALQGYIAELRAKGEKVSFQELQAALSPVTDKATAELTNVVLRLGQPPFTNFGEFIFVAPGQAQTAWQLEAPSGMSLGVTNWEGARSRIVAKAAELAKLRQLLGRAAPNAGPRTNAFVAVTPFRSLRSAAQWLGCVALVHLRQNEKAEALADIQAVVEMANWHREEYSLVSQMTRAEIARIGVRLTWEALQATNGNDRQLLGLQRNWEEFEMLEGLERGLEGERSFGLEILRGLQNSDWRLEKTPWASLGRSKSDSPSTVNTFGSFHLRNVVENDLAFHLRHMQGVVGQARLLRANRPWHDVSESWRQLNLQMDRMTNSPFRVLFMLSMIATPDFSKAGRTAARVETERALAITAIALRRYELKHDQFAPSLAALRPEFLSVLPRDCMSGEPLQYRHNTDGTFALYSVGNDGKDDGGDAASINPSANPTLWDGRDVPWPITDLANGMETRGGRKGATTK
jgi:hypothetical protein